MDTPAKQVELVAARERGDQLGGRRIAQQQLGLTNVRWYATMALLNGASYREVLLAVERARSTMCPVGYPEPHDCAASGCRKAALSASAGGSATLDMEATVVA